MKQTLLSLCLALCCTVSTLAQTRQAAGYPITPVPFTHVHLMPHTFWGQRLQASREVTIPLAFSKCESEGRYANFVKAAHPSPDYKVGGFSFDDTDVYKTIEGASYVLMTYPDQQLTSYIDSVLSIVATAQESDGYLYTSRTMNPQHPHEWAGKERWEKVEDLSHEFYNLGHMVEGAVAHYQATGKRNFLDIAIRYADCVCRAIGPNPGQKVLVPGHQIAEMALCRLYLATGNKKYLEQAKFFLDMRGKTSRRDQYSQAHLPVTEQSEAVGHAVRAAYMYAGMADVAALTGDSLYIHAIDRIWDNIVSKKLYITGGIGATASGEAFGANYELPNMSAYCETCAAIGNVYVNHRLFLLHGDSKYYDVLERVLYNGVISGISLDGGRFFYPNPLESMGQHQRQAWFGCACCPSNVARFIPSIPGYFYQVRDKDVYVNLYGANETKLELNGKSVALRQQTNYPWQEDIQLTVGQNRAGSFTLRLRIPGWVQNEAVPSTLYSYADKQTPRYKVLLNGNPVSGELQQGYLCLTRRWKKGDRVDIHFDMPARMVRATEEVEADRGRVAIERGPLVYCAEFADNDFDLGTLLLRQKPSFRIHHTDSLTASSDTGTHRYPLVTMHTEAQTLHYDEQGQLKVQDVALKLIPYYAWNHRGSGRMMVWMPYELRATRPSLPPSLASLSRLSASTVTSALRSIQDRLLPKDANDRSVPYYHWWPAKAKTEWLQYELPSAQTVCSSSVYWFDDGPWGGCRTPKAWRLYYRDAQQQWQPVQPTDEYGTRKGTLNTVHFAPVQTDALRMEIDLPEDNSAGLYEWEVEAQTGD